MAKVIATDISTEQWYYIIKTLRSKGWEITSEYKLFDKGIDHDSYTLKLNNEKIKFAWDNWVEGEIKCNPELMDKLKVVFKFNLQHNTPVLFSNRLLNLIKRIITK